MMPAKAIPFVPDEAGAIAIAGGARFSPWWTEAPANAGHLPVEAALNEKIGAAYESGFREAQAQARAAARAESNAVEERVSRERQQAAEQATGELATALHKSIEQFERRVREEIAAALAPFLLQRLRREVADDVMAALARLSEAGGVSRIRVAGPEAVTGLLCEALVTVRDDVEIVNLSGDVVQIDLDDTKLLTELPAWLTRIEEITT